MSSVVAARTRSWTSLVAKPEVRQITQRRRAVMEHEADGIDRIVRHGERLDRHVLDLEIAARGEQMPVAVFAQAVALAAQGFGGERVAVNRQPSRLRQSTSRPLAWSQCSCVSRMPSSSSGVTPACASRVTICRALRPASTSRRHWSVVTSAQLPALPLPRTVRVNMPAAI